MNSTETYLLRECSLPDHLPERVRREVPDDLHVEESARWVSPEEEGQLQEGEVPAQVLRDRWRQCRSQPGCQVVQELSRRKGNFYFYSANGMKHVGFF